MNVPWRPIGQESALSEFEVRVEGFDGPLDLLLDLIQRQGLDITGVSILAVTNQFLEYAQELEVVYTEAASEFLLVGSQLLLLKSRALLPVQADDHQEESVDDLASRLRVYAAFKAVATDLSERWDSGATSFIRAATPLVTRPPVTARTGDLEALIDAIQQLMDTNNDPESEAPVPRRQINITDRMNEITSRLMQMDELGFSDLVGEHSNRDEIVATFIALLHLVISRQIAVTQPMPFGEMTLRWMPRNSQSDVLLA